VFLQQVLFGKKTVDPVEAVITEESLKNLDTWIEWYQTKISAVVEDIQN